MEGLGRAFDVDAAIDSKRLGGYQLAIVCMCAATVVFDGFDNQTIGILAPSIAKDLQLNIARFGVVFSAGLFGWMLGALAMGPIADRVGRRWPLAVSVMMFGLFSLLATTAKTLGAFLGLWFLTGLGLGGAIPNALALATEFAPRRLEAKVAGWVITGMPVGAILGGLISTFTLQTAGWRPVLYIGGALPLLMAAALALFLPESPRFLIAAGAPAARIKRILQRMAPAMDVASISRFQAKQSPTSSVPVRELFSAGRAYDTLLFWLAFFGNLLILYFVLNWFPAMLHGAGMAVSEAIIATTLYSVGGGVGTASEGYIMDAVGWLKAPIAQLFLSAVMIAVLATQHSLPWLVWAISVLLGLAVQGSQAGLNALAAAYYPTTVRSTGLGWALGIGRLGAVVGPLLGELMLSLHWSLKGIFMAGMIPSILAGLALCGIAIRQRSRRSFALLTAARPSAP